MKNKPKNIKNFRDLGGVPCCEGKTVKQGLLFKSGHFAKADDKDLDVLQNSLGIKYIFDLRGNAEINEKPDYYNDNFVYKHNPPLTDEQNPSINRVNRNGILEDMMAMPGGTTGYVCGTYRTLVTSEMALDAYRELMQTLLLADGGVVWHCTQGKDRTGVGTAIVLMALGADREAITKDYLGYNKERRLLNSLIYFGVCTIKLNPKKAKALDNILTAKAHFIKAAFDEIDKVYGSTEDFLHNALKLSDDDINTLRNKYLA